MTKQTNDFRALENSFVNALGSGRGALKHLLAITEAAVTQRDTQSLKNVYWRAYGRGDQQAMGAVKFLIRTVWPGSKATFKDAKTSSIKISGCDADEEAMDGLRAAVESNLSIRGAAWKSLMQGDTKKAREPFTKETAAKAVAAQVKSKELSIAEVETLAAAYAAQAKAMREEAKQAEAEAEKVAA